MPKRIRDWHTYFHGQSAVTPSGSAAIKRSPPGSTLKSCPRCREVYESWWEAGRMRSMSYPHMKGMLIDKKYHIICENCEK